MPNDPLDKLDRLLAAEEAFTQKHNDTRSAKWLKKARTDLSEHIREVVRSGDLPLIVATERVIIQGDHDRYANSTAMTNSLKTALNEIDVIERHIGIVDDPAQYRMVDQAYRLPRNRKGGLPLDEARQALASHYARLTNMDKARLDDDEKEIVAARKTAIFSAGKLYAERQAKTLGVPLVQGKTRERSG
jgi:hypothetical protein